MTVLPVLPVQAAVVQALAALTDLLRVAFFVVAAVALVVFTLDWLVRTRRINPFSPIARFFRRTVDPLLVPIERRVVRHGGMPSSAPWWALVAVVVIGILVIVGLQWLARQIAVLAMAAGAGPAGLLRLLVIWTFGLLQIALIVRVIASWVRVGEYSRWVRWAYILTEPILRPLRNIIPPLGMIDITPLVAWFALMLLQPLVLSILP